MTRVCLDVRTWHNDDDDKDGGPWSYRGTTSGTVERVYVSYNDYDYGYRGTETDLEPPFFVVYATYYTGDTLGYDFEACVVGVVKEEWEAYALREEARSEKGWSLSNGFHVPWNGYFDSLIDIHIERVP
jgi:hypothetical protein